jgi:hypothetical protein
MLETILVLSIAVNIVSFLYARWLIKMIKVGEEDVSGVAELISQYVSHVNSVHEMEMFYGDPTLAALISHGKELVEKIDTLDYIVLTDPPMEEFVDEEEEE